MNDTTVAPGENQPDQETRPAHELEIQAFRQILIWPLALEHRFFTSPSGRFRTGNEWEPGADLVREVIDELELQCNAPRADKTGPIWERVPDPLRHIDPGSESADLPPEAYAEFVYFHGFVQRFLYQRDSAVAEGRGKEPAFALFRCTNVARAVVDIPLEMHDHKVMRYFLNVERLNLYLFNTGVAVLAIEVDALGVDCIADAAADENPWTPENCRPLTLHDVLAFQDCFRRCYAPYWGEKDLKPGEVPSRVAWLDGQGKPLVNATYGPANAKDEFERLDKGADATGLRIAPMFEQWRKLLPIRISGYDDPGKIGADRWRHVVDERMPSMAYVALKDGDLAKVSRGDRIRLCFADAPGSDPLPYDKEFLQNFEEEHCYQRFRSDGALYMFAGYAFTAIGEGRFFRNLVCEHFRRHYFQMALLSHFESAALLNYSNWISEAVARFQGRLYSEQFEQAILNIQEELLSFVHQYRFTGLSNQLQAGEMQAFWRRHLKLDKLYDDLQSELKTATDYLLAKDQTEQTRSATGLAGIAAFATVVGLPMAFLGMTFLPRIAVDRLEAKFGFIDSGGWCLYAALTLISSGLGSLILWAASPKRKRKFLRNRLFIFLAVIAVSSFVFLLSCFSGPG